MQNIFSRIFKRSAGLRVESPKPLMRSKEPEIIDSASHALTLPTVYRCVELISNTVAMLPLRMESNKRGHWEEIETDISHALAVEPNGWTSAFDFWKQAVQNRLLFGEGLIIPRFEGDAVRFILASPGTVSHPDPLSDYTLSDYRQNLCGTFSEEDVIRVKGLSIDGGNPLSVIGYARRTASIAATAERNALTTFANGGVTKGIITNEGGVQGYGEYADDALRDMVSRMNTDAENGDMLISMSGKGSFIPMAMSAADMQFLESRKFQVLDICRFFGVHPSFVYSDTATNYKSAEMANVAFYSNTLAPILRQIENELDRKLTVRGGGVRFRFDMEALHATDLESKVTYIEKRIQAGTLTPNEARLMLGAKPVKGGDEVLVSANFKTLEGLKNESKKTGYGE